MNQDFFVRRMHFNLKDDILQGYAVFLCIILIRAIIDKEFNLRIIILLAILLVPLLYLEKLSEGFGIYIINEKVYNKYFIRKEIDINSVVGIKVIKAIEEIGAWPVYDLKDADGNNLYTMIFLSEITNNMRDYPGGDVEFLSVYREDIITHCVYDERLIDFFKERIPTLEIL